MKYNFEYHNTRRGKLVRMQECIDVGKQRLGELIIDAVLRSYSFEGAVVERNTTHYIWTKEL